MNGTAADVIGSATGARRGDTMPGSGGVGIGGRWTRAGARVAAGVAVAVLLPALRGLAVEGDDGSDDVATSVAGVGDVNGDGKPDVAVGTIFPGPGRRETPGTVKVFSGKDGSVLWTLRGTGAKEGFGDSVASAGDVNGDGKPDIAVGAKKASPGGVKGAGQARVFSGKDGSLLLTVDGKREGGEFGWSVAGAGDVDHDGKADLAVGAIFSGPSGGGLVKVFSGKDGAVLRTFEESAAGDLFGAALANPGDLDGDGVPDLVATSRGGPGSVRAFSGKEGKALWTVKGKAPEEDLGFSVAAAGDLNGDGTADVAACAWAASPGGKKEAGEVRALSGKDGAVLWSAPGESADDHFGEALAGIGDVNGDGKPDVAASAPWASGGTGLVRILSGKDGSVLRTFPGPGAGAMFGSALAPAGDINGDKVPDVLVGAGGFVVTPEGRTWQARVLSGKDGAVLLTLDGSAR